MRFSTTIQALVLGLLASSQSVAADPGNGQIARRYVVTSNDATESYVNVARSVGGSRLPRQHKRVVRLPSQADTRDVDFPDDDFEIQPESDTKKRDVDFPDDDFEIKPEADNKKRDEDFPDDDFEIQPESDTKKRDVDFADDDFEIQPESDD